MNLVSTASVGALLISLLCLPLFGQEEKSNEDKKSSLRRGTMKILDEQVIPSIQAGDDDYFLRVMAPIIRKASPRQLADIEAHCQLAGIDSVKTQFADIILKRAQQGNTTIVEKVDPSIALYLADELSRKVDELLRQVRDHAVMKDPLAVSDDWQASEQMFWEIHVFNNEFLNAQSLVDFGVAVLKPHRRRIKKSDSPESLAILNKLEELVVSVPAAHRDMMERDAELRWKRLDASYTRLNLPGGFETLLTSAMCVELDAEKLNELFAQHKPGSFSRPILNDPLLPNAIEDMVKSARLVGDQIAHKAILFRSGLHYWLRGRYGSGPLANGLLKGPESMNSLDAMEGLYMPKIRPSAINNRYGEPEEYYAGYERRHYYTWAVEYRPLLKKAGYTLSKKTETEITDVKTTGQFW